MSEKWKEVLKEMLGLGFRLSGAMDRLREATRTVGPLGTDDFVSRLEAKLGRLLFPNKPGPKPKPKTPASAAGESPYAMEIGR